MSFYHHAKFGFLVITSIFAYCGPEIKRENRNWIVATNFFHFFKSIFSEYG